MPSKQSIHRLVINAFQHISETNIYDFWDWDYWHTNYCFFYKSWFKKIPAILFG